MEDNKINIQTVMQEICLRAGELAYEDTVPFESIPVQKTVSFYREITGNPIVRFIKKVIRKLVFFLLEPMAVDINMIQTSTGNALAQLDSFANEQIQENRRKDEKIRQLEERLSQLEERLTGEEKKNESKAQHAEEGCDV